MTRIQHPDLTGPPCPPEARYLWTLFTELSGTRSSNGYGPNCISWMEMQAWSQMKGLGLSPFEIDALRSLDTTYLSSYWEEERRRNPPKNS